eukprot:7189007-Heterocapsa_arctica.AAC.1
MSSLLHHHVAHLLTVDLHYSFEIFIFTFFSSNPSFSATLQKKSPYLRPTPSSLTSASSSSPMFSSSNTADLDLQRQHVQHLLSGVAST